MHTCFDCQKQFPSVEALEQHRKIAHPNSTGKRPIWPWIVSIIIVVGIVYALFNFHGSSGQYDDFAQCIADSGARFYGAFWCPHCADQKAMFGTSVRYLPYVECSTPDGKSQLQICTDAGIDGYPTWVFADGSRGNVMTLQELSQKTDCPLP